MLTFDEKTHTYQHDGENVISVTQILKWKYPRKYQNVDEQVLKVAAERGMELHNAIEIFETIGLERVDMQEFRDYKFIKKTFGFKVEECEKMVMLTYNGLKVAGRFDQLQSKDGMLGIADIKRTATLDKNYLTYQLNLYRLAYQETFGKDIQFLAAIHLKEGNRKYIDIKINEKDTYALLDAYNERKKK